ncbi:hypothetical protein [Pseudozobellia thermophila]|uniref:Uncharacterized protein n=1 Tax=Pseudozobellia thermophila TaxID=192903 RepID=A0A1M6BJ03_9FLAO|nr:hypothetical protein [Pseudozobellia thermophila]SHI48760.1 hypothetical protein SAMN04488513_101441 [Pseudozobellia thermophila]
MDNYQNILEKLDHFTRKYHTKILIKGVLMFLALGCLFFFAILAVEYFLWLQPTGRLVLLLLFVAVLAYLLIMYIINPLFYLFKIKMGISEKEASRLIGKHFPEVGDKLYNLLELAENREDSELVLASIEQRSSQLGPVPFKRAVDYRENLKYTKYLIFPLLIFLAIWFSGNLSSFFGSADRVVHYKMAYEPPAPFHFQLLSEDLEVLDNETFTIAVTTLGDVQPGEAYIGLGGKELMMQRKNDRYEYTLSAPLQSQDFYFTANGVRSRAYTLKVIQTPVIHDFKLVLDYPAYIGKQSETIEGTGNASFPEGTVVSWHIEGVHTDKVRLMTKDTIRSFKQNEGTFQLSQRVFSNMDYELATSNKYVEDYEKLAYRFEVIRDEYPTIGVNEVRDSLNPNVAYYEGQATDDYRLKGIKLVCYDESDPEKVQTIGLAQPETNFHQFYYTFPSGLQLEEGRRYSYYFSAVDNDAIHGGKEVKSQVYSMTLLNGDQLRNEDLRLQQSLIQNLDRSLDTFKEQKEALNQINESQREKKELNFNDQSEVKDFLQRQRQQESQMEKFSKQLSENLGKDDRDDPMKKLLQERLERQEIEARKNQKLLEELNKVADKINKNELTQRLEQLAKKQQNSERNLEQLLELTKRYYVSEKAGQLAKDLQEEAEKQKGLSELKPGEEFSPEEQEQLNKNFDAIAKELEELKKDNSNLKKPMDLELSKEDEEAVRKDQEDALKEVKKLQDGQEAPNSPEAGEAAAKASKKQKSAAQKMQEMSESLSQSAASSGGESSDTEDAEMLRQVLDNLVTFSFKQEGLYERLDGTDSDNAQFSNTIKEQQNLRELFEHVDDSIFALSLRRAELSEFVNEQITEVYYNIDKSLESIAENQIYQGASYQKYVLNASNSLAAFLARVLDNMQQSMMSGQGQGQGEGEGFQLPDIIKSQGELKEKMEGMGQSGKEGQSQGQGGKGQQKGQGEQGEENGGSPSDKEGNEPGKGSGQKGNGADGSDGNGEKGGQGGLSESELSEIYEIYKEQQMLRQKLEQQLQDMMNEGDKKLGEKLVKQMEDFERDLLENGITQRGLDKVNRIQHELMKLENATLKQGKKSERESNTNTSSFVNPIITKPSVLENYRKEVEILNRQALPLRQNYQNKVKEYFKGDD